MFWLGLTGGIATGKSRVSKALIERGEVVIDADQIARQVVAKNSAGLKRLIQVLGPDIVDKNGELSRREMGAKIFAHPETKVLVESILHPLIREEVQKQKTALKNQGLRRAFYDIPLLFETRQQDRFDAIIVVYCPDDIQTQRLMLRDGLNHAEAQLRIQNQLSIETKRQNADHVIDNSGTLDELEEQIDKMLNWVKSRF